MTIMVSEVRARPVRAFAPDYAVPPGQTLLETLAALGMTQQELAQRIGRPLKTISEIAHAKAAITPETAIQLEQALGIPAHFWLSSESNYRESLARSRWRQQIAAEADRVRDFPYAA